MDTSVRWGPPAPGTKDGDEEAAPVHRRVQERGGQAAGGERQDPAGGRPGARGPRQPAQGLAQRAPRGQLGRGPGAAEGRGGRAGAAAAGGEAARAGERDPQEGRGFFRQGGGRLMRYRFVAAERATFPVRTLCRIVGVAVSGFYVWLRRGPGRRRRDDRRVSERIAAIFEASRRTYGSPRVHAELRAEGGRGGRQRGAGGGASGSAPGGWRGSCARAASPSRAGGAASRGPPTAATTCRSPRTCSTGGSPPSDRTRSGWPTSPTSRPARAGCTWPRSRTWPRARSSAGRWPTTSGPSCASTPWSWPSSGLGHHAGWSTTATVKGLGSVPGRPDLHSDGPLG